MEPPLDLCYEKQMKTTLAQLPSCEFIAKMNVSNHHLHDNAKRNGRSYYYKHSQELAEFYLKAGFHKIANLDVISLTISRPV